ncbi:GFA family protein [Brenneria izbisi]|uniref:GFA family protein n=1 Tax=Brenneria izbisi TaxID=2939450 RepID=A0AA41XZR2_9GAMM|nr:GFA family protein [Brenneria izbisi]MCV9879722.1 GFA family protein [Brenneria izbisi]MCV9883084.1 GFA family protein [Brenneria izbisi]
MHHQGRCLCGAVTLSTRQDVNAVTACHCGMCQKWGGGPFMSVDCKEDIAIAGVENITAYRSSEWAERAFCKVCGSHLFYKLLSPKIYFVPVALFEDKTDKSLVAQIYIDNKPAYYSFAQHTSLLTEQDVMNLLQEQSESLCSKDV